MATHQSNPIKKGLIIVPIIVSAIIFGFASIELDATQSIHQWVPKKAVKWHNYISKKPDSVFTWRDIEMPAPSRIITKNNYILINKKNAIMFNGKVENEEVVIELLTKIISQPAIIEEKKGQNVSYQQLEAPGIYLQRDIQSDPEFANNLLQKIITIYNNVSST